MSIIRKYQVLSGFALGAAFMGLALAGVTGFGSIKLVDSPGLIKDSGGTTRIALATASPNLALTGTVQFVTTISSTSAPAAAGILARDSANIVYISTGTGTGAWVKVGGQ